MTEPTLDPATFAELEAAASAEFARKLEMKDLSGAAPLDLIDAEYARVVLALTALRDA